MNKFFGQWLVGEWLLPDGTTIFPNQLKEDQDKYLWKPDGDVLWPHDMETGKPLQYDEAA